MVLTNKETTSSLQGLHSIAGKPMQFYSAESRKVEISSMAYKIAGHSIEVQRSPSAEDLRCAFERAVCDIHQADLAAKKRLQYRSPIVPRARILGLSQAGAEKRALTDAARALAQLWKV
jgi:hypothetical protein